jgi:hypothetical protein
VKCVVGKSYSTQHTAQQWVELPCYTKTPTTCCIQLLHQHRAKHALLQGCFAQTVLKNVNMMLYTTMQPL